MFYRLTMAESKGLSATDVARLLNSFGSGGFPEDVHDVLEDYFTGRKDCEESSDEEVLDVPEVDPVVLQTPSSSCLPTHSVQHLLQETCLQFSESVSTDSIEKPVVSLEPLLVSNDYSESELLSDDQLDQSVVSSCGCVRQCSTRFPQDMIKQAMLDCSELDSYCDNHVNHQHLLLLGAMNALVHNQPETIQNDHKPHARIESRSTFMFRGVEVCRKFFSTVFGCGEKRLKNVKKQFLTEGVVPRQHGNVHKPGNLLSFNRRKDAVLFIHNFAENHALVMPGRLSSYKNFDLKLLPSSLTKKHVYDLYAAAAQEINNEPLSLDLWYKVWSKFCANIVVQLPRSDLCAICQKNQISVSKMRNLPEDEKLILIKKCEQHLLLVERERAHYDDDIKQCRSQCLLPKELGIKTNCSFVGMMHQSFDFAQQIHLPHDSQQVGPIYFLTGYKVALFGIAIEPLGKFLLYIIPEACATGKGSNIVLSLLHHYFENFGIGETESICHADNCCGQNKNNYVMQYACWRTCTLKHKRFTINFLPVGHTKFWPDLYFGLFKKKLRKDKAETIADVCRIAKEACPITNAIIPVPVGDEAGHVNIPTYDWQTKFSCNMITVPDIKQYHQFVFSSESKGNVCCKKAATESDNECIVFNIVKNLNQVNDQLPAIVSPPPFAFDRRKYLAEKIRPFVSDMSKDVLCPFPDDEAQAGSSGISLPAGEVQTAAIPSVEPMVPVIDTVKRKTPVCGYCHVSGHRNQVRNGVALCPKRRSDFADDQH